MAEFTVHADTPQGTSLGHDRIAQNVVAGSASKGVSITFLTGADRYAFPCLLLSAAPTGGQSPGAVTHACGRCWRSFPAYNASLQARNRSERVPTRRSRRSAGPDIARSTTIRLDSRETSAPSLVDARTDYSDAVGFRSPWIGARGRPGRPWRLSAAPAPDGGPGTTDSRLS